MIVLDQNTSGIIDASSVSVLTGSESDKETVRSSGGITGLPGSDLHKTNIDAEKLNSLDSATTGIIDASNILTITGKAADMNTAYESDGISGLGNEAAILSDTSLSASILNALDENTSGVINAESILKLTGKVSDLIKAYNSPGIIGLGNEKIILSDTHTLSDLVQFSNLTTGTISLSDNSIGLEGSSSEIASALALNLNDSYKGDITITSLHFFWRCLIWILYTSPSPRDRCCSRMPSSA